MNDQTLIAGLQAGHRFEMLQVAGRVVRIAMAGGDPWSTYDLSPELAAVLLQLPDQAREATLGAGRPRSHRR